MTDNDLTHCDWRSTCNVWGTPSTFTVLWSDERSVLIEGRETGVRSVYDRQRFLRLYAPITPITIGCAADHPDYGGGYVHNIINNIAFVEFCDEPKAVPVSSLTACPPSRTRTATTYTKE